MVGLLVLKVYKRCTCNNIKRLILSSGEKVKIYITKYLQGNPKYTLKGNHTNTAEHDTKQDSIMYATTRNINYQFLPAYWLHTSKFHNYLCHNFWPRPSSPILDKWLTPILQYFPISAQYFPTYSYSCVLVLSGFIHRLDNHLDIQLVNHCIHLKVPPSNQNALKTHQEQIVTTLSKTISQHEITNKHHFLNFSGNVETYWTRQH